MPIWNEGFLLATSSHVTSVNQSEWIALSWYCKICYFKICLCHRLGSICYERRLMSEIPVLNTFHIYLFDVWKYRKWTKKRLIMAIIKTRCLVKMAHSRSFLFIFGFSLQIKVRWNRWSPRYKIPILHKSICGKYKIKWLIFYCPVVVVVDNVLLQWRHWSYNFLLKPKCQ